MIIQKLTYRPFVLAAGLIFAAAPVFAQTPVVRIVGVSNLTPTNDAEWRGGDGKAAMIPKADSRFEGLHLTPAPKERGVRFLIEILNAPKERSCDVQIDKATGLAWISFPQPGDTRLYAVEANLPESVQSCDMRVGVSKAEWRDVAEGTGGSTARAGSVYGADGKPKTFEVIFSDFSEFGGAPGLTVSTAITSDQDIRVVGVDAAGGVIEPQIRSDQSINAIEQRTVTFPGKSVDSLKSVKVQARPYDWREFKGVKLPPVKA
ncbi:MAG: hypothetical protein JWQ02_752 [Capsulimonas sp.]|jgi:hypothetical protein|nr:hypothetical protein [Capsulimonas sp.]